MTMIKYLLSPTLYPRYISFVCSLQFAEVKERYQRRAAGCAALAAVNVEHRLLCWDLRLGSGLARCSYHGCCVATYHWAAVLRARLQRRHAAELLLVLVHCHGYGCLAVLLLYVGPNALVCRGRHFLHLHLLLLPLQVLPYQLVLLQLLFLLLLGEVWEHARQVEVRDVWRCGDCGAAAAGASGLALAALELALVAQVVDLFEDVEVVGGEAVALMGLLHLHEAIGALRRVDEGHHAGHGRAAGARNGILNSDFLDRRLQPIVLYHRLDRVSILIATVRGGVNVLLTFARVLVLVAVINVHLILVDAAVTTVLRTVGVAQALLVLDWRH